jgi:hypothetical protein
MSPGARRPDGKARGARTSGICERRATPPAGMPRPGIMSRITVTGHRARGDLDMEVLAPHGDVPRSSRSGILFCFPISEAPLARARDRDIQRSVARGMIHPRVPMASHVTRGLVKPVRQPVSGVKEVHDASLTIALAFPLVVVGGLSYAAFSPIQQGRVEIFNPQISNPAISPVYVSTGPVGSRLAASRVTATPLRMAAAPAILKMSTRSPSQTTAIASASTGTIFE